MARRIIIVKYIQIGMDLLKVAFQAFLFAPFAEIDRRFIRIDPVHQMGRIDDEIERMPAGKLLQLIRYVRLRADLDPDADIDPSGKFFRKSRQFVKIPVNIKCKIPVAFRKIRIVVIRKGHVGKTGGNSLQDLLARGRIGICRKRRVKMGICFDHRVPPGVLLPGQGTGPCPENIQKNYNIIFLRLKIFGYESKILKNDEKPLIVSSIAHFLIFMKKKYCKLKNLLL